MQVEVRLEQDCKEPRVVVYTDRMTDEVKALDGRE